MLYCCGRYHAFRGHHPYTLPANSITKNKLRTAAIWMDEYAFITQNALGNQKIDIGTVRASPARTACPTAAAARAQAAAPTVAACRQDAHNACHPPPPHTHHLCLCSHALPLPLSLSLSLSLPLPLPLSPYPTCRAAAGPLDKMMALRKRLECKPFSWYMDEVYPTNIFKNPTEIAAISEVKNVASNYCLDTLGNNVRGLANPSFAPRNRDGMKYALFMADVFIDACPPYASTGRRQRSHTHTPWGATVA